MANARYSVLSPRVTERASRLARGALASTHHREGVIIPGGGPHVKVFNGMTLAPIESFFAYTPAFIGGVYVGAQ